MNDIPVGLKIKDIANKSCSDFKACVGCPLTYNRNSLIKYICDYAIAHECVTFKDMLDMLKQQIEGINADINK